MADRKEQDSKELNYMGINKEGKFECVASPNMPPKDLAKEVAKWIRWGLSVERCNNDFVRANFGKIIKGQGAKVNGTSR